MTTYSPSLLAFTALFSISACKTVTLAAKSTAANGTTAVKEDLIEGLSCADKISTIDFRGREVFTYDTAVANGRSVSRYADGRYDFDGLKLIMKLQVPSETEVIKEVFGTFSADYKTLDLSTDSTSETRSFNCERITLRTAKQMTKNEERLRTPMDKPFMAKPGELQLQVVKAGPYTAEGEGYTYGIDLYHDGHFVAMVPAYSFSTGDEIKAQMQIELIRRKFTKLITDANSKGQNLAVYPRFLKNSNTPPSDTGLFLPAGSGGKQEVSYQLVGESPALSIDVLMNGKPVLRLPQYPEYDKDGKRIRNIFAQCQDNLQRYFLGDSTITSVVISPDISVAGFAYNCPVLPMTEL